MIPAERLRSLMAEALAVAETARLRVEPNPPVGALVLDAAGEIVGRGCTQPYGGPHAEAVALGIAGDAARGGTLVSTLEPCAHTAKKTPPCARAIVASGVARVVVGAADPNPETTGRARAEFDAAGIAYEDGVLADDCAAHLSRYVSHLGCDVPWTIAKWAMTADGHTADAEGGSRWITGAPARRLVHDVRARVEAVIVGVGTVLADDPQLTARDAAPSGRPAATRVVFDSALRTPLDAKLVATAGETPTLVICGDGALPERRAALGDRGVEVVVTPRRDDGRLDVRAAFRALRVAGVRRALLECGGTLMGSALRAGVVHQVMAFTAPVVVGGTDAPGPFGGMGWPIGSAPRWTHVRASAVGDDALLEGYWPT